MDGHSLDLPFEPHDQIPMLDKDDAVACGGLVVRAGTIGVPEFLGQPAATWPLLVWTFYRVDGSQLQPLMLALPDEQMAKLRPLIFEAMATARRAAKSAGTT